MKINRFPKMAALQYKRALKLGFDESTAKAIGIAEATKYAIFKNISQKRRMEEERKQVKEKFKKSQLELENETFKIFKLQALNGLPVVGDKVYSEKDYERYFEKWGDKIKNKIEEWAENIVKNCNEKNLESENRFFNECWKPHRDELKEI